MLVAGLQIESVQPYHVRYRLHSGTVGGFFLISENVFVCTAGHCATVDEDSLSTINDGFHEENMKKYDPEQSEIDIKSFVKQDNEFDIAVLPLFRIKKGFSFLNPFYMDDDVYANEGYFKQLSKLRRPSFDSCNDSLHHEDDFPFLDPKALQPGTIIGKFGITTGITFGLFVGVKSIDYMEGGKNYSVDNAVVVQWEPGQRFTQGGDSGSVYYAKIGSFTYPIAIHRAQVVSKDKNYLEPGKDLAVIVSIGTSLYDIVQALKKEYEVERVQWFKDYRKM